MAKIEPLKKVPPGGHPLGPDTACSPIGSKTERKVVEQQGEIRDVVATWIVSWLGLAIVDWFDWLVGGYHTFSTAVPTFQACNPLSPRYGFVKLSGRRPLIMLATDEYKHGKR